MKLSKKDSEFIDPVIYRILHLVSKKGNIKNIGSKSRRPELVRLRRVFFALCKRFTISPLSSIGHVCGDRDHTTVLHNIKEFYIHYDDRDFEHYKELYLICYSEISQWEGVINNNEDDDSLEELKKIRDTYKIKMIKYQKKNRIIIESLNKKLYNLRKREIFSEIAGLDDEDLDDFEIRAKAFLSMKRIKDKQKMKIKTNETKKTNIAHHRSFIHAN